MAGRSGLSDLSNSPVHLRGIRKRSVLIERALKQATVSSTNSPDAASSSSPRGGKKKKAAKVGAATEQQQQQQQPRRQSRRLSSKASANKLSPLVDVSDSYRWRNNVGPAASSKKKAKPRERSSEKVAVLAAPSPPPAAVTSSGGVLGKRKSGAGDGTDACKVPQASPSVDDMVADSSDVESEWASPVQWNDEDLLRAAEEEETPAAKRSGNKAPHSSSSPSSSLPSPSTLSSAKRRRSAAPGQPAEDQRDQQQEARDLLSPERCPIENLKRIAKRDTVSPSARRSPRDDFCVIM